jgi:hypothetical protein
MEDKLEIKLMVGVEIILSESVDHYRLVVQVPAAERTRIGILDDNVQGKVKNVSVESVITIAEEVPLLHHNNRCNNG